MPLRNFIYVALAFSIGCLNACDDPPGGKPVGIVDPKPPVKHVEVPVASKPIRDSKPSTQIQLPENATRAQRLLATLKLFGTATAYEVQGTDEKLTTDLAYTFRSEDGSSDLISQWIGLSRAIATKYPGKSSMFVEAQTTEKPTVEKLQSMLGKPDGTISGKEDSSAFDVDIDNWHVYGWARFAVHQDKVVVLRAECAKVAASDIGLPKTAFGNAITKPKVAVREVDQANLAKVIDLFGEADTYGGSAPDAKAVFDIVEMGKKIFGENTMGKGLPVFVSRVKAEVGSRFPNNRVYATVNPANHPSINEVKQTLGEPDEVLKETIKLDGNPTPVQWYVYGWCHFGVKDGATVWMIRADCTVYQ